MENKNFRVIFDGFETEAQALEFAVWYSEAGEQNSDIWLEEHTDIKYALVEDYTDKANENNEIIVNLKLYKK